MRSRRPRRGCRAAAGSSCAVASAARRLDHDQIARRYLDRGGRAKLLDTPVRVLDAADADRSVASAREAARRHAAAVGQDPGAHRLEETDAAHRAVAAAPGAGAPRSVPDRELLEPDGK